MDTKEILNSEKIEFLIDLVKCNICLLITIIPTSCRKCEAVFCKECIENWKKKDSKFPLCRKQNIELNEDCFLVKNIINKFT